MRMEMRPDIRQNFSFPRCLRLPSFESAFRLFLADGEARPHGVERDLRTALPTPSQRVTVLVFDFILFSVCYFSPFGLQC